jgi:hypothetical protein
VNRDNSVKWQAVDCVARIGVLRYNSISSVIGSLGL